MKITITQNFPQVQARLEALRADIGRRALVRAVNRTIDSAKTDMSRKIRAEFNVTKQRVDETLRVKKANFYDGAISIEASLESRSKRGRSLNLINFVEKSVTLAAARKRMAAGEGGTYAFGRRTMTKALELRFKIKRGAPAKTIKGAFIGNQGRTVFIRVGKKRLPIKGLQTVDIPQMFNTKRINAAVVQKLEREFPARFESEARYYAARFSKGAA